MLHYVCENAIMLMIIALMTSTIVTLGYVLLSRASWFTY